MDIPTGWAVIVGSGHGPPGTVSVIVLLSAEPQVFVTRTQKDVVAVTDVEKIAVVPVAIGLLVSGFVPRYHW